MGAARRGMAVRRVEGDTATLTVGGVQHKVSIAEPRRAFDGVFFDDRFHVIDEYLDAFAELVAAPKDESLDEARDRILPRVGPPLDTPRPPPSVPLVEGLLEIYLVLNEASRLRYITRADLDRWGLGLHRILPLAVANLRRRTDARLLRRAERTPGVCLYPAVDSFVSTRVMLIRELVDPWPSAGAVLAVPDRSVLALAPIGRTAMIPTLDALARVSREAAGRRPFPITDDLVWFDGHQWEIIKVAGTGAGLHVEPTARLLDALANASA